MNTSKFLLTIFVLTILAGCSRKSIKNNQSVNAIIGDISFIETFGHQPDKETNEQLRLQTHLKYVEIVLRSKDVSHLTLEQKENRFKMLDLLNDYWTTGVFPKNYDYPDQRIPCFIDKDGNICAVGYLIEKTAGRQIAEEINSKFQYEYLLAMNDKVVDNWVQSSGLTKEECAMIQPYYGPVDPGYISPTYAVSTSLLSGLNLSLNTINGIQISKGSNNKMVPVLGMVSGASQITLGVLKYPEKVIGRWGDPYYNPTQRNFALLNIGLGTSTLVLSSWNLITNRKPKEKPVSWNIYNFRTQDNNMGLAFSFTKRI